MFMKLLVCFYTMIQLSINYILMGLITYFIFEVQINYMWLQKIQNEWNITCYCFLYYMYSQFSLKLSTPCHASTPILSPSYILYKIEVVDKG
jgi:hypothetical protein